MIRRCFLGMVCVALCPALVWAAADYRHLQAVTVRLDCPDGQASGVLVTRTVREGVTRSFVWTGGHVVESLRQPDGSFAHLTVHQEYRDGGRQIGDSDIEAAVIAYSDQYGGEDLAILEVLCDNFRPVEVSAAFYLGEAIPAVGSAVVHVGSPLGLYNSVSQGIISQTDRDLLENGKVFDQTTTMAYPGSSGGGVYFDGGSDCGACVGLLVRGVGPGLNFIVPVRRMRAWAGKQGLLWAMAPGEAVPPRRSDCIVTPAPSGGPPLDPPRNRADNRGEWPPAVLYVDQLLARHRKQR